MSRFGEGCGEWDYGLHPVLRPFSWLWQKFLGFFAPWDDGT